MRPSSTSEPGDDPDGGRTGNGAPLTPVQVDTGRIIAGGTGGFAVAFVVLVALRLAGVGWVLQRPTWLWTALAGAVLGLVGLWIIGRHRRLGRTR